MSRRDDGSRRDSFEERQKLRTARLALIEPDRIAGPDPAVKELLGSLDLTADSIFRYADWTEPARLAAALCTPVVLVGAESPPLHWLANPYLARAAQANGGGEPIVAVVLARQISRQTRLMVATAGLLTQVAMVHARPPRFDRLYDLWSAAVAEGLNPLHSSQKMRFVKALRCDPRHLPHARIRPTAAKPVPTGAADEA